MLVLCLTLLSDYYPLLHKDKTMAKKENKTQSTEKSVVEFLNKVEPEQKRKDSFALLEMMQQQTGFEAKMWGDSMIGFGVSL